MFRSLFKGPRTVRVPINRTSVEVQQVKVTKQSRPVVGRFIMTCVITTIVIQGVKRWDPLGTYSQRDVLQEELEKVKRESQNAHGDKYGDHWSKQHSQMKAISSAAKALDSAKPDALRITIPIWLRPGAQRMYTEADPEWKEFVKLQGDTKRAEQIKRQIGESVMHQVKEHGRNKFELAVIKFNGRVGVALDIVPQVFTPPIYEVPCIWISTSSISAGWRPLPPQTGTRMERVFRPVVLLEASTAAMKTFFWTTYGLTRARILETVGRKTSDGSKPTIFLPQVPTQAQEGADTPLTETSKSAKPFFPAFPDLTNSDAMRKMHADLVGSMPYSTAIQHAAFAFNYVRMTRQKLAVSTNVKGICQVRGFITFFGDRGRYRMEVIAYYLPADNVFVGAVNVQAGYIVQDYRSWEKLNDKDKQQKLKEASPGQANVPPGKDDSPPDEPTSPNSSGQDKEANK